MTVENCIERLNIYKAKMNDESLPAEIRKQSKKNYENMIDHIMDPKSKKFKDHPIRMALKGGAKPDVKKSKR